MVDHDQKRGQGGSEVDKAVTRSSRFLALGGVAAIAFGVIVLVWPGISLVALTALFGAFAFVYGAFAVGAGLNLVAHRSTDWVPYVLGGLVGVAIGVVTFFSPGITALTLVYFIAAWAIIIGLFEIVAAVDLYGELKGAAWLGVAGALSVVFGVLIAIRPGAGVLAILWLIGFYSILGGVLRLVAAYRIRQVQGEVKSAVGALRPQS
jgi:uncharacterized membrane protein HdeD (DUF308 family)